MKIPVYLHTRFQKILDKLADEIKTKVNNVIKTLEDGTYRDIKKLAHHKDLYRAKVDQCGTRILFYISKEKTTQKEVLLIVDLIENHDYHKSVYIKQRININENVSDNFNIKNIVPDMEFENKLHNSRKVANIVISHNKAIVLTDSQEKVLETQLPAIINGAAGSGKTSVALESIRKIVADLKRKGEEERKVAYITLSKNLVQESEKSYWNIEKQDDNNKNQVQQTQVEFLTYDSFLKNQISSKEIEGKKPVDRKFFLSWFKEQSNKGEYKYYKNLGDQIFEEFSAVITGSHTTQNDSKDIIIKRLKDNYYKRGVKQSIFTKDKHTIFKLYEQWKEYILNNKEYYDSNIIAHKLVHSDANKEKIYDVVVVDETQDLTLIQLKLILDSIKNTSDFLLCCDENQVIHPSFFSQRILDAYFYDKVHAITKHSLDSNYRNSPMVKLLINGVLHVKEKLFPISSKKQSNMQLNTQRVGEQVIPIDTKARYLKLTDKHKEEISNTIQTSIKLVVIVPNDNYKEKAKKTFPSLLVFNVYEIKGLEYPHVILFNFFSANKQQCDKILNHIVANSGNNLEINKAESKDKHDKSFEESKFYVNALYVAVTRGIKTVSIIEEQADIENRKTLIDYLDEKMYLTQTDDIEKILEGNTEDSLSDLKNEAMKLTSRGNTEQAKTIVCNIREKYIDGNNKENKQEAEKYIKEIEDRIKSDSDKENNQLTNYAGSDNDKLKTQVNEILRASAFHDNSSGTPDRSTGAIPKTCTPTASWGLPSTRNENSTKSGRKHQRKGNKKTTINESRTDKKEMISNLKEEWKRVFTKGCSENKIMGFLKENLENIKKVDQEFRNEILTIRRDENIEKNMNSNLLHYALKHNCKSITKLIVTNKLFGVNSKADDGLTPLHIATLNGATDINVVRLLIQEGAEVYAKADDGSTPLHFTAQSGAKKIADLLLKQGADFNAKKNDNVTPLHFAAHNGHTELAKLLLYHKAEVNATKNDYTTPLHITIQNGHIELAKLLIDNSANVDAKADNGAIPLHFAVHYGHTELAKLLLMKGANVDAKTYDGTTPLHFAAHEGHIELAKLLIDNSANVNAKTHDGTTPLHFSVYYGHTELAKLLLMKGANVDAKADNGATPLHFAVYYGYTELAELLLMKGANVDAKADNGATPLHFSVHAGRTELAKLLLRHRAEVNATKDDGTTPLHFSVHHGHTELAKLFLRHSANVDAKADNGATPLHFAAHEGHTEVAKLLIDNSANVDAKAGDGTTPLHIATHEGHIEVAKLLIDNSANVDAKADNGTTPLHFAAHEGHTELAKLLIMKGANSNAIMNDCITPLHAAINNDHMKLAKLLFQYEKHSDNVNTLLSSDQDKEYEQLVIKVRSQISNRLQLSKNFYTAVKLFWEQKMIKADTSKKLKEITELLYNRENDGILLDVYHTVDKHNAIILAIKCKDQTLLQLLLNYAVKTRHIRIIKDLLGIKKDNDDDRKLLVDAKYVEILLNVLKNDKHGADIGLNKEIIELLTVAIDNSLPTNTSKADSNPVSKDSDTGKSNLSIYGITENTDSGIEVKMNDNYEPKHMQLGGQSQKCYYDDNAYGHYLTLIKS